LNRVSAWARLVFVRLVREVVEVDQLRAGRDV
jgi:hypothetical protein